MLFPLMGIPAYFPGDAGVINTYIKDEHYPSVHDKLYVLCNKEKFESSGQVKYKLTHHDLFLDRIEMNDRVLLVYDYKEHLKEVEKFIKGKYSKLKKSTKNKILQMFLPVIKGKASSTFTALYPTDVKSMGAKHALEESLNIKLEGDYELLSSPDISRETFKLSDHVEMFQELEECPQVILI